MDSTQQHFEHPDNVQPLSPHPRDNQGCMLCVDRIKQHYKDCPPDEAKDVSLNLLGRHNEGFC